MVAELGSVGVPVITAMTPPDLLTPLDRYLSTLGMTAGAAVTLPQPGAIVYALSPTSAREHKNPRGRLQMMEKRSSPGPGSVSDPTPSPPGGNLSLEAVTPEKSPHDDRPYPGIQNSGSVESWNTLDSWGRSDCM